MTSIESQAFEGCSSLTSITIPSSINSIETFAFHGCNNLASIVVESGNTKYDSRDNCNAIVETSSNTLILGCCNTVIPNSVTTIGNGAFFYLSSLISIIIPNGVVNIDWSAFSCCTNLTSVIIGSGVRKINGYAFDYCYELTDVYCYAENVPSTGTDVFENTPIGNATLHVPASSVNKYMTTKPWKYFKEVVVLSDSDPKPTRVKAIESQDMAKVSIYDISGHRIADTNKGLNIIRMSDGTTKKVVVK
ncbi:MAG: leucine-rich repeat domain-containing protein [Aeriscardovia sp.]|nr:leucine-rich repeat domain-containing protein [Aeriscardovia sp.]